MIILQCPLDTRGKGEDRALSNELHSYWVNFAKTGDPNGAGPTIVAPSLTSSSNVVGA